MIQEETRLMNNPIKKTINPPVIKKRNRAESTQKFLDAALEIFSEVGFDAATTKSIAQRAGLNESLIQRYFQSKAGLIEALVRIYAETAYTGTYPNGKNLEEEIYNYLKSRYDLDTQNPDFVRVGFHRVMSDPSFAKSLEEKYRVPGQLLARLKTLQKNGQVKPEIDIRHLAQIISAQSFLTGIVEYSIIGSRSTSLHLQQFKLFARFLSQGVASKKT